MRRSSRPASIDYFRGFAVLATVLASYLFGTEDLPAWLLHAPDGRLPFLNFKPSWHIFAVDVNLLILLGGTP
jgi:hypothetical protein